MTGIFKAVRLSTIKFVKSTCDVAGINYQDWDDNADLTKIPAFDLAGLHGFAVANDGKLHDFSFGVTCQTVNDPNLFRMTDIVDRFYGLMLPEKSFSVLDPNSGAPIAVASFINGSAVHPMNRVENRVTVSIQGSFVVNLSQ